MAGFRVLETWGPGRSTDGGHLADISTRWPNGRPPCSTVRPSRWDAGRTPPAMLQPRQLGGTTVVGKPYGRPLRWARGACGRPRKPFARPIEMAAHIKWAAFPTLG